MKYLKISEGKGFYWDGTAHQEIDKIDKKGLLLLLNAAETDEFDHDPYDENKLHNRAHQVIYENLHNKLEQFLEDKEQFKREVESLYEEAMGKYSSKITDEDLEEFDNLEDEELDEEAP